MTIDCWWADPLRSGGAVPAGGWKDTGLVLFLIVPAQV